jgi:hypothetical protein
MYGWSLLYQLPGLVGVARIDAGETTSDLPAAYESPQELLDRTDFLAARGIATRPLALVTQPEDIARTAGAAYARNRFVPHAVYQRTCDPADFCQQTLNKVSRRWKLSISLQRPRPPASQASGLRQPPVFPPPRSSQHGRQPLPLDRSPS